MKIKDIMFQVVTAAATVFTGGAQPWWMGAPTKLLRKTPLVLASAKEGRLPVYTLTFEIPQEANFTGRARPHASVCLDLGDVVKMVIPGYKPKSYSMSAIRENEFDVTFKVYPNGRASGFLDRLQVGDTIGSFGMQAGRRRNAGSYVGIVAYGVGITEALPVARAELEKGDAHSVVLLWAARTQADTFWREEMNALQAQYPEKFQLQYIFSRELVNGSLHGRINANVLARVFHQASSQRQPRFLSVGTKAMMAQTDAMLAENGFPMTHYALLPKSS